MRAVASSPGNGVVSDRDGQFPMKENKREDAPRQEGQTQTRASEASSLSIGETPKSGLASEN